MDCQQVEDEEVVEQYLANRLSEEDRTRFEEHYFECERCLARLNALQAVRGALLERRARRRPGWVWPAVAAAAAVLIGAVIGVRMLRPPAVARVPRPAAGRGRDLGELARLEPPPYAPPTMRGSAGADERRLRAAMAHYQAGDYVATIPALEAITRSNPSNLDAAFFLGACDVLTGRIAPGIAEMKRVAAAGDASPYTEEAHYYLGQAYLLRGDAGAAKKEFEWVVEARGDLRAKAAEMLRELANR